MAGRSLVAAAACLLGACVPAGAEPEPPAAAAATGIADFSRRMLIGGSGAGEMAGDLCVCKKGRGNTWQVGRIGCPDGVEHCDCEDSDGHWIDANSEQECLRTQGLTEAQIAAMVANGVDPADHECSCCTCHAGVGASQTKICDEHDENAWDPDNHSCSTMFYVWMMVFLVLIGGGVFGYWFTQKKKYVAGVAAGCPRVEWRLTLGHWAQGGVCAAAEG